MKIVVYAISKNEEKHVDRFMDSCRDADQVIVCDTGSTDGTVQKLKDRGATVYNINVTPWRFDDARNIALSLTPEDADICIALDLDEMLTKDWRQSIEAAWTPGTTRVSFVLDWSNDIFYEADRIHARKGYRWVKPCHEVVRATGEEKKVKISKVIIEHRPDMDKSRTYYLDILKQAYIDDPSDDRNLLYYGRELTFHKMWQEAIEPLLKRVEIERSEPERAYAARLLGVSYLNVGNEEEGVKWLEEAAKLDPKQRCPLFELAKHYYEKNDYANCLKSVQRAIEITQRAHYYFSNPAAWNSVIYDLAGVASYKLGLLEKAKMYGAVALAKAPHDSRLMTNLNIYIKEAKTNDSSETQVLSGS